MSTKPASTPKYPLKRKAFLFKKAFAAYYIALEFELANIRDHLCATGLNKPPGVALTP